MKSGLCTTKEENRVLIQVNYREIQYLKKVLMQKDKIHQINLHT